VLRHCVKGTTYGAFSVSRPLAFECQRLTGKPVGCMKPSCQANKTPKNNNMETATRSASAHAMRLDFATGDGLPRNMKNSAVPSAAKIPKNPKATKYDMSRIIR
jgi:hypothetical protein